MITLKQLKSKLEKDFGWENLESDDNKWFVDNLLKDTIQAIEVIHSCKSDSEQLPSFLYKSDGGLYFKHLEDTDITDQWNKYLKTR